MDDDDFREEDLFTPEAWTAAMGDMTPCEYLAEEEWRFIAYRMWSNARGGKKPTPD